MKTLFKLSFLAVAVIGVLAALVNPEKIMLYAGTGKRIIQEKIDEAQGLETKLALLDTKVEGLDEEIAELKTEVVRRQIDVEYLEDLVSEKTESHEKLAAALARASELLDEAKDTYRIGHRAYTFAEISRDAAEKLKLYKIQGETLQNLLQTLETKRSTLKMAADNVANAGNLRNELVAKVRYLKAELEKFKAKEIYVETVKTQDLAAEFKTEIGQTQKMLAEFEKQLQVKDRMLDEKIRLNTDYVGGIDYTTTTVSTAESNIVAEIKASIEVAGTPEF